MLKKLMFAEQVCNFAAILLSMPTMVALSGNKTNTAAVGVLVAVVFLLVFAAYRLRKRINAIRLALHEKLPIKAEKATVVKRRVGYRYRSGGGRSGRVRSSSPMYYVTFETQDGCRRELYVLRDVYFASREGKQGVLRHKGDEFISFN